MASIPRWCHGKAGTPGRSAPINASQRRQLVTEFEERADLLAWHTRTVRSPRRRRPVSWAASSPEVGRDDRLGRRAHRGLGLGVVDVHRGDVRERNRLCTPDRRRGPGRRAPSPRRPARRPRRRRGAGPPTDRRRASASDARAASDIAAYSSSSIVVVDVPLAQRRRDREAGQRRRARARRADAGARSRSRRRRQVDPHADESPAAATSAAARVRRPPRVGEPVARPVPRRSPRAVSSTSVRCAGFIRLTPIAARSAGSGVTTHTRARRRAAARRRPEDAARDRSADGSLQPRPTPPGPVDLDRRHRREHENLVDIGIAQQIDRGVRQRAAVDVGHAVDHRRRVPRRESSTTP